jgi:hypothetical protein
MTDTSTPAVLDLATRFEAACSRIGDGQPNRISDLLRELVRERDELVADIKDAQFELLSAIGEGAEQAAGNARSVLDAALSRHDR